MVSVPGGGGASFGDSPPPPRGVGGGTVVPAGGWTWGVEIIDCIPLLIVHCLWEGGVLMVLLWPMGFLSSGAIFRGVRDQASWCVFSAKCGMNTPP